MITETKKEAVVIPATTSTTTTTLTQSIVSPTTSVKTTTEVSKSSSEFSSSTTIKAQESSIATAPTKKSSDDLSSSLSESTKESYSFEPDSLEVSKLATVMSSSIEGETEDLHERGLTLQQQLSMTSSSMSGVSLETVIEKDQADRRSPDSDSFELVEKPDLIDDFVVIEEVGREAEEFDSEGNDYLQKL